MTDLKELLAGIKADLRQNLPRTIFADALDDANMFPLWAKLIRHQWMLYVRS